MQKSLFLEEVGCGAVGFLALPGAGVMRRGGGTSRGHAESVTVQRGRRNSHTCIRVPGEKKQRHALGPYRALVSYEEKKALHCKY